MDDQFDHHAAHDNQTPESPRLAETSARDDRAGNCQRVACDLPPSVLVVREEIAILKAFLSDEIRATIEDVDFPAVE